MISLAACDLHSSDNGDLDQNWYLTQVDTLATGGIAHYREQKVFWTFQAALMQTTQKTGGGYTYLYRFDHNGDQLIAHTPILSNRDIGDSLLMEKDVPCLQPHGINAFRDTFTVVTLNGDDMVLQDKLLRLHFISY